MKILLWRIVGALTILSAGINAQEMPVIAHKPTYYDIETTAKQAILVDYQTGAILLDKNADEPMAPSSMTKIMTVDLILERLKAGRVKLDDAFPVSPKAWKMDGSKMFVDINSQVKLRDLLRGIIVQSGNDACIVVAEGFSGQEETFATEMTRRAHELGATKTTFKNASGMPHPEHMTTARDLMTIATHTIKDYPEYYELYSEKEFTYNKIKQGNRNPLLYKNIGCDGMKTGHTEDAGYGLTASAIQEGRRLVLVINGLSSMQERSDEATKLMTWGFRAFETFPVYKEGQIVENATVASGVEDKIPLTVSKDCVVTLANGLRKNTAISINYNKPLKAPIAKGSVVGKIVVTAPNSKAIEFPLIAAKDVARAGFFKRMWDMI